MVPAERKTSSDLEHNDDSSGPSNPVTHSAQDAAAKTLIGGSAAAGQPVSAGRPFGPYQLLEKLGEGGMGAVYKARHTRLGKIMAVKILPQQALHNPEIVSRFEREMLAVGQVQHPNVVQAHDAGEVNGIHYLAMEFVEGQDVQKLVDARGRLSIQNACKLIRQASLGLAAAHQRGLVHRDLKPANLFITKSGTIKVLDLGLARLNQDAAGLTSTGECFGTPDYMAPEQWEDAHLCDARTDLYALGCTLFCLLTGKPPFGNDNYSTAPRKMVGHVRDAIPDLQAARPDTPSELVAIYQRLMAKNPAERIQSAQELAQLLVPFVKGTATYEATMAPGAGAKASTDTTPGTALPTTPTRPAAPPPRPAASPRFTTRLLIAIAALAGIAAIAAGIIFQIETPAGTIVIAVDQPEIAGATVSVDGNQKVTIKPGPNQDPIEVTADAKEHTLRVVKGGFETFTQKFTVKAGKMQTIEVTLKPIAKIDPAVSPPAQISQMEAARRLMSLGCLVTVKVGEQIRDCSNLSQLPTGEFEVIVIWGSDKVVIDDGNVDLVLACPKVEVMEAIGFQLSPASLQRLASCSKLERLQLISPISDDSSFAALCALPHLKLLVVDVSKVTPAGFQHFAKLTNIEVLTIQGRNFDDTSLHHLKHLEKLSLLHMDWTNVRGSGLKELSGLKRLQTIGVNWSIAGNEGLAAIAAFKQMRSLDIESGQKITDEGLAHLAAMTQLKDFRLRNSAITNDGLKYLKGLKDLEVLELASANIDGDGLQHLVDLPLKALWLNNTKVGDPGVAAFRHKQIADLALAGAPITDAGLLHLKEFKHLERLVIGSDKLTSQGLAELRRIPTLRVLGVQGTHYDAKAWEQLGAIKQLQTLFLNDTNLDDVGLGKLTGLNNLHQIEVHRTNVTDAGLLQLKDLPNLNFVNAVTPKVTPEGRDALLKLLPSLRAPQDRQIAEWVLKLGGTIRIRQGETELEVAKPENLPTQEFVLLVVDLGGNANVTDENVATLRHASRLRHLGLGYTQITDRGLEWIGELKQLEDLCLWHSQVTGETIKRLETLTELRGLLLNAVPVGDKPFESIAGLKKLERLHLHSTGLTNRSVEVIAKLPNLRELCWCDVPLSASELSQLKGMKLDHLDLNGSNLSVETAIALRQFPLVNLGLTEAKIQAEMLEPFAAANTLNSLGIQGTFADGALAPLARLKTLLHLYLEGSNIANSDLAHLSELSGLVGLRLSETKITDEGLVHLEKLTSLQGLDVIHTKLTAAGLKKLHLKIPQCRIEGPDGLVLKPELAR